MNTRVQDFLFFDEAVAVPVYEVRENSFFGAWSTSILGETRAFLIGVMSFVSAMTTSTKEYTLRSEPILKDIRLEVGDTVRWDRTNIPADLRVELGSGAMRVIEVTMVSDDVLLSVNPNGKRYIPDVPFSPTPIAQVVALRDDGKMFIAPNYYFERAT
jgi:hypothetical protein